jgi:hypothetical protein
MVEGVEEGGMGEKAFCWWVGQKGSCFIGVLCSRPTHLNCTPHEDATLQERVFKEGVWEERKVNIPRLESECDEGEVVSWVVVVGVQSPSIPSLEAFLISRCGTISVTVQWEEEKEKGGVLTFIRGRSSSQYYRITVIDPMGTEPIVFETHFSN